MLETVVAGGGGGGGSAMLETVGSAKGFVSEPNFEKRGCAGRGSSSDSFRRAATSCRSVSTSSSVPDLRDAFSCESLNISCRSTCTSSAVAASRRLRSSNSAAMRGSEGGGIIRGSGGEGVVGIQNEGGKGPDIVGGPGPTIGEGFMEGGTMGGKDISPCVGIGGGAFG